MHDSGGSPAAAGKLVGESLTSTDAVWAYLAISSFLSVKQKAGCNQSCPTNATPGDHSKGETTAATLVQGVYETSFAHLQWTAT